MNITLNRGTEYQKKSHLRGKETKRSMKKNTSVSVILKIRTTKNKLFLFFVVLFAVFCIFPLFLIIFYLMKQGISAINWDFLFHLPKPVGEKGGGISNALIGTVMLIITASIISIPLGIAAGIYLSEFRKKKLSYYVRLSVDVLQGIPSIVIGIIAYLWIVKVVGTFSALSGGVALGIMMLPLVVKSTEETLKLIPYSLKEASLSLGVPYSKTILKVILPSGLSGILTGILISIARIAGETAPLLFTAFGSPFMNLNIFKPINSLPLLIYNYASSPYPEWHKLAWGASFILIVFVFLLNLVTKGVTKRWKVQF